MYLAPVNTIALYSTQVTFINNVYTYDLKTKVLFPEISHYFFLYFYKIEKC